MLVSIKANAKKCNINIGNKMLDMACVTNSSLIRVLFSCICSLRRFTGILVLRQFFVLTKLSVFFRQCDAGLLSILTSKALCISFCASGMLILLE